MPSPISREGMALCHGDLSWRFVMAICHGGLSRRFVVAIQSVSGHRAICSLSDIYILLSLLLNRDGYYYYYHYSRARARSTPTPRSIPIPIDPDRDLPRTVVDASRSIPIPIIICQVGPQGQLYNFVQQWPPDAWHFLACLHHCQDLGHP